MWPKGHFLRASPPYEAVHLSTLAFTMICSTATQVKTAMGTVWTAEGHPFPKDVHVQTPRTRECSPLLPKGLCRYDQVKALEMGRLAEISQVGPMSSQGPSQEGHRKPRVRWRSWGERTGGGHDMCSEGGGRGLNVGTQTASEVEEGLRKKPALWTPGF